MRIITLNLFLKDALKNLKRNATSSISTITTVMATLFVLGIFLLFMLNLKMGVIGIGTQSEIQATLKYNIKITDQQNIYNKIKAENSVTFFTFRNDTPLSAAYIIKVNEPNDIPKIISRIKGLKGINKINVIQNVQRNVSSIAEKIQWVGVILFPILIIASFFLIKNTIKLAIYPRRNEISIMQQIGATDWFIIWPFIFYGIIIGFLGAVFAVIAIYLFYSFIYRYCLTTTHISFINPSFVLTTISWHFILIGIIIEVIGSIFVIKKYLIV
ncbi:cell division protein FtsX [Clostridium acidisoli DSM 12555]|uniref:Cell division protein FtsX n=1 Tax=Clostridium acidisoli DSM 12555 TaxID=1121291 RepID=A0A1W1WZ76_9CLOT|nr:FtsX-like permease family protein [Clostridium acidisoli]SMC16913.1 cell division protein FtsX [Clostridium acidisoli DSM 12555]